jgi:hypothetical protein
MTADTASTLVIEIAIGSHWSDRYMRDQHIEVTGVSNDAWQVRYRHWRARDGECFGDERRCAVHYFLTNYRPGIER